jgi:hypothetical protein
VGVVHTHFGSATHAVSTFLAVVLVGGLWRLGWMHLLRSPRPWLRGLARAALFQYTLAAALLPVLVLVFVA